MFWEKGRWSRKARREDDLALAKDMARIELDADQQRAIQRSDLEHNKRMTEMQEQARLNRGAAEAEAQTRLDAEKKRIEAQTEAEKSRGKYVDELIRDKEYEERDQAGRGLALDFVGKIDPVTGEPHTQASALAQGALAVRGAETAKPREMLNIAEKYKALFPRIGEAAREAQETEIGASRTERYKQGLQRDQSLFEQDKLGGARPYAERLGRSAAERDLSIDEAVREKPILGLGGAGSAIIRGEEDRKTAEEKARILKEQAELYKKKPSWRQRLFGTSGTSGEALTKPPQRRVFHFGPAATNSPADELTKRYLTPIQH
jgi:hypothetical protein